VSVLEDKVFGCLAASQIGSAMGAVVEGWDWRRIEKEHGRLERLLPYEHYSNGWQREPGTTEDGIERQRVFLRAIRRARGRIAPQDVAAVWREEVDAELAKWCMEPFDRYLIGLAKAGVPASRVGEFSPYADLISLARSCHPIGLVNALNPEQAWKDVHTVGLVLQGAAGTGLDWAGLVAAVIAEGCRPGATLGSAMEAGLALADEHLQREVRRGLKLADEVKDPLDMRELFTRYYSGSGVVYAFSHANEIVSKAFAVLKATGASPRQTVITAVNFGRDTDCLAAVAGGIAGAVCGRADLPQEWIDQLDRATRLNPYTCLKLSLQQMTGIVVDAVRAGRDRMRAHAAELDEALA